MHSLKQMETIPAPHYPDVLQEVDVTVNSIQECTYSFPFLNNIKGTPVVCAGMHEKEKDACFGDSGGPLIVKENGRYTQIGVVSFGPPGGCGRPDLPGGYARITSVQKDWIELHSQGTQDSNCNSW